MIENLKDLEKLLKLLRKQGVQDFKMGDLQLKIGDLPVDRTLSGQEDAAEADPYSGFPEGLLTPEQLMFYSSGGLPEDDPLNQVSQ